MFLQQQATTLGSRTLRNMILIKASVCSTCLESPEATPVLLSCREHCDACPHSLSMTAEVSSQT